MAEKKKIETKRGRGRPKGSFKKKEQPPTDLAGQEPPQDFTPKGIISEGELLQKVDSIRKTGESLPEEHQTEIAPGESLESELISAGEEQPGAGTEGEPGQQPATGTGGETIPGDVILEMENNMLMSPIEEGLNLERGFLSFTKQEQNLAAKVRPDDLEIKKSAETYWLIVGLLNVSKFLKWLVWNWRKRKDEKKKATEEKPKDINGEQILRQYSNTQK